MTLNNQRIGETMGYLKEEEEKYLLIGGIFNVRTGNEEGSIRIEGIEDEEERKSRKIR